MARIDISVLNHSQQTAVFGGFPERALQARRGSPEGEAAETQRHDQNGQQPLAQVPNRKVVYEQINLFSLPFYYALCVLFVFLYF